MSAIERLLLELETGSDDDRSVAHACRVELDAERAEHERFVADVLHIRGEIEWLGVENDRLRALVEKAYREGYEDRDPDAWRREAGHALVLKSVWERSHARAALAPKETK